MEHNKAALSDIAKALLKGLNFKGNFSNDEMSAILDFAQQQLATDKQENSKNQERDTQEIIERGHKIAEIAGRILDYEMTPDDLAFVVSSYARSHNFIIQDFTGEDIEQIYNDARNLMHQLRKYPTFLRSVLHTIDDGDGPTYSDYINQLAELESLEHQINAQIKAYADFAVESAVSAAKTTDEDDEKAIRSFLRRIIK